MNTVGVDRRWFGVVDKKLLWVVGVVVVQCTQGQFEEFRETVQ